MFISLKSQRRGGATKLKKLFEEMGRLPKLGKRHKITGSKSSVNPKQDEPKEIQSQTSRNQTVGNKTKKKFFKVTEKRCIIGEKDSNDNTFLIRNWRPEEVKQCF